MASYVKHAVTKIDTAKTPLTEWFQHAHGGAGAAT